MPFRALPAPVAESVGVRTRAAWYPFLHYAPLRFHSMTPNALPPQDSLPGSHLLLPIAQDNSRSRPGQPGTIRLTQVALAAGARRSLTSMCGTTAWTKCWAVVPLPLAASPVLTAHRKR